MTGWDKQLAQLASSINGLVKASKDGGGKAKGRGRAGGGGARGAPQRSAAGRSGVRCVDGVYRFPDGKPVAWRCWACGEFHVNDVKQDCRACGEVRLAHPISQPGVFEEAEELGTSAAGSGRKQPDSATLADAERRRKEALASSSGASSAGPKSSKGAGKGKGVWGDPDAAQPTRAERAAAELEATVSKYLPLQPEAPASQGDEAAMEAETGEERPPRALGPRSPDEDQREIHGAATTARGGAGAEGPCACHQYLATDP